VREVVPSLWVFTVPHSYTFHSLWITLWISAVCSLRSQALLRRAPAARTSRLQGHPPGDPTYAAATPRRYAARGSTPLPPAPSSPKTHPLRGYIPQARCARHQRAAAPATTHPPRASLRNARPGVCRSR